MCHFVLVFFCPFVVGITSLGEERELISVFFVRLFDLCLFGLSVSSSSWCLGRAAVCDCGTPWTFLLPFFLTWKSIKGNKILWKRGEIANLNISLTSGVNLHIYL